MKKLISILSAALLVMLACIPACATETISEAPGSTDIPVYAKYVDSTGFLIIPIDEDGNGSVILPDGTEILVSDASNANGRIIVEEVTDPDVLAWAAGLLGDRAADFRLFYIYWIDGNGKTQPVSGATVTIRLADNTSYTAFALDDDKSSKLDAKAKDNTVTFTTDGSSFYALCSAKAVVPGGKAPQTGDDSKLALWLSLLLASGGAGILAIVYGRKKNAQKQKTNEQPRGGC